MGEDLSVIVPQASAVALTTGTASVVASATLGPGVWDVGGAAAGFTGTATTTLVSCGAGVNTAQQMPALHLRGQATNARTSTVDVVVQYPSQRLTVPAGQTLTVYLLAVCVFTSGAMSAYGELRIRRAF